MDLLRLEQQRQALEQSLKQLRTSLRHWQTWEAEYEGFKEEIQSSTDELDLDSISKNYDGELVNEKEIRDLTGLNANATRTAPQILGMISRRQEYVQKNIETIQRQFWDAEAKLEELDFAAVRESGVAGSAGLPLTEIHEELDDDGNVISSSLSQPEAATSKIVDALRQAGVSENDLKNAPGNEDAVEDIDEGRSSPPVPPPALKTTAYPQSSTRSISQDTDGPGPDRLPVRKKSVSFTADTKPSPEPIQLDAEEGRKSVSFNDKVSVMPAAPPPDNRSVSFSPQVEEIPAEPTQMPPNVQAQAESAIQKNLQGFQFKPGQKVTEITEDDEIVGSHIVIPENESEEEARQRREMLDYHLNEVGHVVAQINLEEGEMDEDDAMSASDFAESSEHPDEDTPYTTGQSESEDDSEDEWGRAKKRVISDDYHKKMQELERKLIGNLGPAPADGDVNTIDTETDPQDVRRLVIRQKSDSTSSASSDSEKKSSSKKRVSFAEAVDVADEDMEPVKAVKHQEGENAAPVMETVTERKVAAAPSLPKASSTSKLSRFKAARTSPDPASADSSDRPSGPSGKIMADSLTERTNPRQPASAPSEDNPDPVMQRRELAAEYYRRRNEMIRQQGGFKASPEDEDVGELMEERDGKVKKVSRFRAARIKPQ